MIRTFIAIEPADTVKEQLGDIVRQLRRCDVGGAWVKPNNLHLTLKFLGNVDAALVPRLIEQIAQVAEQRVCFDAELDGFGFFPSPKRPRILYAAVREPLPFKHLAQHIDRLLEPLGFAPERHFHPHITLARLKSNKNLEKLRRLLAGIALPTSFPVTAINLCSSSLHVDGARYQLLHRSVLA